MTVEDGRVAQARQLLAVMPEAADPESASFWQAVASSNAQARA
jgi:hypothetical protein